MWQSPSRCSRNSLYVAARVVAADSDTPARYASTMHKSSFSVATLVCILQLAAFTQAQQTATAPVTIRVSDQAGAAIAHAQIKLVPSPEQTPAKLETDDHGQLALNLKAGGYALSVSAQGFTTWSERIVVSSPQVSSPEVKDASQIFPVFLQVGEVGSPQAIYGADTLVLSDDSGRSPIALSRADFHLLPHISATVHNSHTNTSETYSGVPLATLLAKINAPLGKELHGEAMTSYVVATGSDGYSVVLSLAEVDPSFHEGQVIVADARDGQPLGKSGPFQLVVSDDKRPARWVHNLVSITLQRGR